jgi:hypothetical protein
MKFAESGLVCDTIIAEKNLQLEQSFQLINKQKKTIESNQKIMDRRLKIIKALGSVLIIETAVLVLMFI